MPGMIKLRWLHARQDKPLNMFNHCDLESTADARRLTKPRTLAPQLEGLPRSGFALLPSLLLCSLLRCTHTC